MLEITGLTPEEELYEAMRDAAAAEYRATYRYPSNGLTLAEQDYERMMADQERRLVVADNRLRLVPGERTYIGGQV